MKTTYTFNECYEMLAVDPKTFRGWLKEADINPNAQVSRADKRVRYLTKEQVDKMAVDHGRLLRTPSPDEPLSLGAFKLLEDRVTNTEEGLSQQPDLLEKTEQRFTQQLVEIRESFTEQLAVQLAELEQFRTTIAPQLSDLAGTQQAIVLQQQALLSALEEIRQARAQQMEQINETLAGQQREIQQIRSRMDEQHEQLETTAHQLVAIELAHRELSEHNQQEHTALRDAWAKVHEAMETLTTLQEATQLETMQLFTKEMNVSKLQDERIEEVTTRIAQLSLSVEQLSKLPAAAPPSGAMLLWEFAAMHYISQDEAVKKWKTGLITGTKGTTTSRSTRRPPVMIDARGKHDFWVQFHEAPGFRSCDDCPHAIHVQEEETKK